MNESSLETRSLVIGQQHPGGELAVRQPIEAGLLEHGVELLAKRAPAFVGQAARIALGDDLQRRDPGRGGQGIGVERAGVLHLRLALTKVENVEDVRTPGQATSRKSAGENLGQRRKIGLDMVISLSAAGMDAKAADDLVENQQSAMFLRQLTQGLKKFASNGHGSEMAAGSFQNHAADLRVFRQGPIDGFGIVRRHDDRDVADVPGAHPAWPGRKEARTR